MRKPILLLFTFALILHHVECRSWFPTDIIDSVANKTTEFKDYVRQKGRSIKDYYVENVKNTFSSYFGDDTNVPRTTPSKDLNLSKHERMKIKFNDYLTAAENSDKELYEAIVPKKPAHECNQGDPSIHMTTPQLIALNGYPAESHTVITDDGYILTLHRIPHTRKSANKVAPKKTVLLHHGLLGSSADWIIAGPGKSLAYILSDAGYDVWMANARGNTYSRAHVSRSVDSFSFWNFTFHEISQHDLPSIIDYVMEVKGWDVKINYVGHSMGTTVMFALLSTKTQYNKVLRAGFALAPVAYMSKIKSPIRILARFANNIEYLMKLLGANEFLPQNAVLRWLSKHACEINHYEEAICENSLFVLCGHDEKQFNRTLLPLILGHVPAGASTKTLVHYAQEIRNRGKFQQFDYGAEDNMKYYGSTTPPAYPLKKITLPIALISAQNDWLAGEDDVNNLFFQLSNPIEHYVVPLKEFNHIDFLWAVDAPKLVYKKVLDLLEEGSNSTILNSIYHSDYELL